MSLRGGMLTIFFELFFLMLIYAKGIHAKSATWKQWFVMITLRSFLISELSQSLSKINLSVINFSLKNVKLKRVYVSRCKS